MPAAPGPRPIARGLGGFVQEGVESPETRDESAESFRRPETGLGELDALLIPSAEGLLQFAGDLVESAHAMGKHEKARLPLAARLVREDEELGQVGTVLVEIAQARGREQKALLQ